MKPFNVVALGAAAISGLLAWSSPSLAALSMEISPGAVEGPATAGVTFEFALEIEELLGLGIDTSDGARIGAVVSFAPSGTTSAPAPFVVTEVLPGTYFDTLFNPVGLTTVENGQTVVEVTFSTYDQENEETLPLPEISHPERKSFAFFQVVTTGAAVPGTWLLTTHLFVDNEFEPRVMSEPVSASITLVPEPETYALFAAGLVAVAVGVRRRH